VVLTGERFPLVLEITSRERHPISDLVLNAEIANEKPGHGVFIFVLVPSKGATLHSCA
jgi:hypothetical protein